MTCWVDLDPIAQAVELFHTFTALDRCETLFHSVLWHENLGVNHFIFNDFLVDASDVVNRTLYREFHALTPLIDFHLSLAVRQLLMKNLEHTKPELIRNSVSVLPIEV